MLELAGSGSERARPVCTITDGTAKPMPAEAPTVRLDGSRHADQATVHVDQHAARVARVDRRVGLDDVRDRVRATGEAEQPVADRQACGRGR